MNAILFGGLEAGQSTFLNAGAKVAFDRVDREGFAALFSTGGGLRQELGQFRPDRPTTLVTRATALGAALAGYQFFADWGVLALFAGPEASFEMLYGDGVRTLPLRFGLRLQGEVWARPSERTLTTATLVLGSARWDTFARFSAGYRLWGAYLGPEASFYKDRTGYQKLGLGVHATDFSFAGLSLRASVGCLYEAQTDRYGPYLGLAAWAALP